MKLLHYFFVAGLVSSCFTSTAQLHSSVITKTAFSCKEFFTTDAPLEMTLVSDFKKLRSDKKKGVYQNAKATIYFPERDSISEAVKIYPRGEFRRETCQMPSLMVNFKTADSSRLKGLKKIKLVCGCSSSTYSEELLLMEYLAYKIYNVLTGLSFKVKLVKMTYKDVANKMKPYSQYSFFIEDVDELAKRNQCKEYQNKLTLTQLTSRNQMTTVALFQYMIGNTDWSVPNYHNIKLVQSVTDTASNPYVVPYDFDFAGLVNAPYAIPHDDLGIEKVTDRLYRGFPRTYQEIESALQIFREKKEQINALIMDFDLLKKGQRETMVSYLDDFYSTVNNKRMVQAVFIDGARRY